MDEAVKTICCQPRRPTQVITAPFTGGLFIFAGTLKHVIPMSDEEVRSLPSKTTEAAARGDFEPSKTTSIFDGTAQNPEWLGKEPQHLQQLMPK